MKKLTILLLLLSLAMTVFAATPAAIVGVMDVTKLNDYAGLDFINRLIKQKETALFEPLQNLQNGFALSTDEFKEFRQLRAGVSSADKTRRILELETLHKNNWAELVEIQSRIADGNATDEDRARFSVLAENYNTNYSKIQKEISDNQKELQEYSAKMLEAIKTELNTAIQAVAKERNLNLVLNKSAASGDEIVFWVDDAINISNDVLKKMNDAYNKEDKYKYFDSIKVDIKIDDKE